MIKHIGVSGNRHGLSGRQRARLEQLLDDTGPAVLHHGDCTGVDEEAHWMALARRWEIVVHPPADDKYRAFCFSADIRELKDYRARNTDIVSESEVLWAFPEGAEKDFLRSGTWMTVRIARRKGISVEVVLP